MKFVMKEELGITTVFLQEKNIDLFCARKFKKLWENLLGRGKKHIILDLAEVDFIDSHSLGILMSKLPHIRKEGGDIKIATPNEHVQRVFTLIRLGELFEIYSDAREARMAFTKKATKAQPK